MLRSFKVLGGSFVIYRFIKTLLELDDEDLSFDDLLSDAARAKLGDIVFAMATDGNHGRGVARAANKLGCRAVIYAHKETLQARIKAIENVGATVIIVNGTYGDAVRRANADAQANGWQVISDTLWPGYQDIPTWVMQGYATFAVWFGKAWRSCSKNTVGLILNNRLSYSYI